MSASGRRGFWGWDLRAVAVGWLALVVGRAWVDASSSGSLTGSLVALGAFLFVVGTAWGLYGASTSMRHTVVAGLQAAPLVSLVMATDGHAAWRSVSAWGPVFVAMWWPGTVEAV